MNIEQYISNILKRGIEINTIYDVGAWMGYWSTNMEKNVLQNKKFILFEGNPYYGDVLKNTGFEFFIGVLSNEANKKVSYYDSPLSGESYYKENTNFYKNDTPKERITNTIDNIIKRENLPLPDFIKIDTQGSELDILLGGISALKNAKIIYTECPIINYNIGAPNIQEYILFFNEQGFYPMNILETHFMDDILVQIDIVFMRKDIKNKYYSDNKSLLI